MSTAAPPQDTPVRMHQTMTVQAMALGLVLLAGLWASRPWLWQGPKSLHIALEIIAALLALVVALGFCYTTAVPKRSTWRVGGRLSSRARHGKTRWKPMRIWETNYGFDDPAK
ncbi:MAG: hypothetical protein FJY97_10815 [candidate division Zixibacteria bacterium]|nr:hypothetical protein [candidate division Zixibacteria bacterium]